MGGSLFVGADLQSASGLSFGRVGLIVGTFAVGGPALCQFGRLRPEHVRDSEPRHRGGG